MATSASSVTMAASASSVTMAAAEASATPAPEINLLARAFLMFPELSREHSGGVLKVCQDESAKSGMTFEALEVVVDRLEAMEFDRLLATDREESNRWPRFSTSDQFARRFVDFIADTTGSPPPVELSAWQWRNRGKWCFHAGGTSMLFSQRMAGDDMKVNAADFSECQPDDPETPIGQLRVMFVPFSNGDLWAPARHVDLTTGEEMGLRVRIFARPDEGTPAWKTFGYFEAWLLKMAPSVPAGVVHLLYTAFLEATNALSEEDFEGQFEAWVASLIVAVKEFEHVDEFAETQRPNLLYDYMEKQGRLATLQCWWKVLPRIAVPAGKPE